ncbi:MAG TPA: carboxylesterase family protein [Candidatus Binatia bacterium]|nr:carboxylesterase family protein [Candidatus Binatia bacterium]
MVAKTTAAAIALVAAGLVGACSDRSGCPTGIVDTTSGEVCGTIEEVPDLGGERVEAFRGIPFGETTAGANRWTPPLPKARSRDVIQATASGPACPQTLDPPFGPTAGTSEDCLTVNVWRPIGAGESGRLPVLVWVYGGSFTHGGTSVPVYDGAYIAASRNVVVVTLNYRVGALGFLAGFPGLTGNYGLMDQQLAFRWVQDNVAGFGGDPAKVTLFGESAGAMSIGLHGLSIPSSAGLFRAILMESNPFGIPYKQPPQAVVVAVEFAMLVGCEPGDLACLRAVPADDILAAQENTQLQLLSLFGARLAGFLVFPPVVDGTFVVDDPTIAAERGALTVPTLLGTNHDEGTIFIAGLAQVLGGQISAGVYRSTLAVIFGAENVPAIVALYGVNENGDNTANLSSVANDYLFGCANRFVARQARATIWNYEFDETSLNIWQGQFPQCAGEACHGDEVPFVFHADRQIGIEFTPEQARLSDEMVGYWASFARDLDPNHGGAFRWPPFTAAGTGYLIFDTPDLSTAADPIANCDFWDGIGYDLNQSVFDAMAAAATAGVPR